MQPPPPSPPLYVYAGTALDGYLEGCEAFVDRNYNFVADDDEPAAPTAAEGRFEIETHDATVASVGVAGGGNCTDASTSLPVGWSLSGFPGERVVSPLSSLKLKLLPLVGTAPAPVPGATDAEGALVSILGLGGATDALPPPGRVCDFDPFAALWEVDTAATALAPAVLVPMVAVGTCVVAHTVALLGGSAGLQGDAAGDLGSGDSVDDSLSAALSAAAFEALAEATWEELRRSVDAGAASAPLGGSALGALLSDADALATLADRAAELARRASPPASCARPPPHRWQRAARSSSAPRSPPPPEEGRCAAGGEGGPARARAPRRRLSDRGERARRTLGEGDVTVEEFTVQTSESAREDLFDELEVPPPKKPLRPPPPPRAPPGAPPAPPASPQPAAPVTGLLASPARRKA